jgi:hypothetical protein
MENEKFKYLLLHIVAGNGNVKRLVHEGYSYSEVFEFVHVLKSEGLLVSSENMLYLSEKGKTAYQALSKIHKPKAKKEWIQEDEASKIPTLHINSVFIPLDSNLDLN